MGEATPFEPRPPWPVDDEALRVTRLELVVKFVEGRNHVPAGELKRAAEGGAPCSITVSMGDVQLDN